MKTIKKIPFAEWHQFLMNSPWRRVAGENIKRLKEFQAYEKCISGGRSVNILDSDCALASPKRQQDKIGERRSLNQNFEDMRLHSESQLHCFGCQEYPHLLS